jgi:hypothetical protein
MNKKPCKLTEVIIDSLHRRSHHVGVSHTLTRLRQRFWVTARLLIKRIIANCVICRIVKLKGYKHVIKNLY